MSFKDDNSFALFLISLLFADKGETREKMSDKTSTVLFRPLFIAINFSKLIFVKRARL